MIGVIFASYSIAMAVCSPIYIKLLKMNPKVILATGLVAEGSAMLVFGMLHYVDDPLMFAVGSFLCRFIEGFGNGCLNSGCK
jgi:sugar phosphate permease